MDAEIININDQADTERGVIDLDGLRVPVDFYERVVQEAEKFYLSEGKYPTNSEMRAALGGGSYSHISPALKFWKNKKNEAIKKIPAIPESLRDDIDPFLGKLWSLACGVYEKEIKILRQELAEEVHKYKKDWMEALSEITELESLGSLKDLKIAEMEEDAQKASLGHEKEIHLKDDVILGLKRDLEVFKKGVETKNLELVREQEKSKNLEALVVKLEADISKQEKIIERLYSK